MTSDEDIATLTALASSNYLGGLLESGLLPEDGEALERQLPAMLAALKFIKEHGETVKVALAEAGDAAEGGLFPGHAKRFDAAHAALAALRKP